MALVRITQEIKSSVPGLLFDLFHGGRLQIDGRTLYLDHPVLPEIVRESDHIRYVFREPISVETPGPNSKLREVRQYKDRIEFSVWPYADVILKVTQ